MTSAPDTTFHAQLLELPIGAALVLPFNVTVQAAQTILKEIGWRHPERRYAIGRHTVRHVRRDVHHVRIERLPDAEAEPSGTSNPPA